MFLPSNRAKLADRAAEIASDCKVSVANRVALARSLRQWKYTGSPDGDTAIYNKLGGHIDRLSSYLYSPSNLRFQLEYDWSYGPEILAQGEAASHVLTKQYRRRNIDLEFAEGVDIALTYGAAIPKIMWGREGAMMKMVMPWQFGVYREDRNSLEEQEAMCETSYLNMHEFWRRIAHLDDAASLLKRAKSHSRRNAPSEGPESYFHSVVLAGTPPNVQTTPPYTSQPGGLVQVQADPNAAILSPDTVTDGLIMNELWVVDDQTGDYTTIQMVEPDILIAPQFRRHNMFVPGCHPYNLIQVNRVPGLFWGRSEIADLMKLQRLLKDRLEDVKKIMSLQYDRLLAFTGFSGITDESYDQFRESGWIANSDPTGKVDDLTPSMPPGAFQDIEVIVRFMDDVSGFSNILSGQGEPGVRAGVHANTLMKTASPRLRDRALIAERQCASTGQTMLEAMQAKSEQVYWTEGKAGDPKAEFMLKQLPDDAQVTVDSHSSSPIYEQDNERMAEFLQTHGVIDGNSLLDMLPVPGRDILKENYKRMQAEKQAFLAAHPELLQQQGGKKKAA